VKRLLLVLLLLATAAYAGNPNPPANRVFLTSTAPVNGTNEVQTLTFSGTITGGTFVLKFNNRPTGPIPWNSTNATLVSNIQGALNALASLGSGGTVVAVGTMTSGIGTITVTFSGSLVAHLDVAQMTATSSLTGSGAALAVSTTTPGVTADGRNSAKGTLCVAQDTGYLYVNTGSSSSPTWTSIAHP
jgi:hypothetical protein